MTKSKAIINSVVESEQPHTTVNRYGTKMWINSRGYLHRIGGPAVQHKDGTQEWCRNGLRHHVDGPAIVNSNGDKIWYRNDKLHRTDGPAKEMANGEKMYYVNDHAYTEEEFNLYVDQLTGEVFVPPGKKLKYD